MKRKNGRIFDVKATRIIEYSLPITGSRRHPQPDGFAYEKHKPFLYKEDFEKFTEALHQTVDHIKTQLLPDVDFAQFVEHNHEKTDDYASNTLK